MSRIEEINQTEINSIVTEGNSIVNQAISLSSAMEGNELAKTSSWVTRLGQLIRNIYGTESQQYLNYSQTLNTRNFYNIHSNHSEQISQMAGIALSIKHDFDNGLLNNLKALIQADIFSDFLEMGEYLLNEKYKDAAAVIIGSVLEDTLKKLCEKNGLATHKDNGRPLTIDPINAELAKNGVYSKLVQKQITTWAHIRNKAAHGEYNEYEQKQVEMMLLFVQDFAEKNLS